MSFEEELQQMVTGVASGVAPSVVRIGRGPGRGVGFVVADGAVLTNAHNIRGAETTVTFADGRREVGDVSAVDVDGDLAVVRVGTGDAPTLAWSETAAAIGSAVLSVTATAGAGTRVTVGTVSAVERAFRGPRGRRITGGIEHTAPLARGSSGSPVVDSKGRLVGVNTHRLGEGFYIAVSADAELRGRVDALVRGESPRRPYLGVALYPRPAARRLRASVGLPERDGLLVREVDEGSPAGRAGLREGDLLLQASGTQLLSPDDLFGVLGGLAEGQTLSVRVLRGTEESEVAVSFEQPDNGTGAKGSA
ncbi:MAG: S1C family serine protease [Acidimicrobiales bacterium]